LIALIRNEVMKIWRKKRFFAVLLILLVLIPIFTYAQMRSAESIRKQMGDVDWRVREEQRIKDYTNRLSSPRLPEEWREWMQVEIRRIAYHLEHDIDPQAPNGVTFAAGFMENAVSLFLPLLVLVVAADLVSSEHQLGTIKLLITRPVPRWKVLLSKYAALTLYVSLIVTATALFAYLIAGAVFGYGGWRAPVLTGFRVVGAELDTSHVQIVPMWRFLLMESGLVWFSCLTVAMLALMVSVLVRSTAAGMGIMLAALIAGMILSRLASSWEQAKYLFMLNLQTIAYLTGESTPVPGMTLPFSLAVLTGWAIASVAVSFAVFTKKDVLH
jgi:ABC-2 type transport system permease protein